MLDYETARRMADDPFFVAHHTVNINPLNNPVVPSHLVEPRRFDEYMAAACRFAAAEAKFSDAAAKHQNNNSWLDDPTVVALAGGWPNAKNSAGGYTAYGTPQILQQSNEKVYDCAIGYDVY